MNRYAETLTAFLAQALYTYKLDKGTGGNLGILTMLRVDPDGRTWEYEFRVHDGKMRQRVAAFEPGAKEYVVKEHEGKWGDWHET